MSTTGTFNPVGAELSVIGDTDDNAVELGRDQAGAILVNGGAVAIDGGAPTVSNTAEMQVFGLGGNDTITLNEANGALPRAELFGGDGNDSIIGGSGNDQIFGQAGNDSLQGRAGFDLLFGGDGNDVLTGGDADDQMFGQGGNDRMIWNPGDDTDLHEGGAGVDTSEVNGGGGGEQFALTANGSRVRFDRLDPAPFAIDIGTTENVVLDMNGGNDFFSATGDLASLISVTVDGGAGDDTILGSNGNDVLLGGDGNDFVDGQQGADVAFLGAGDDVFQWDPGDGSDVVEGQAGTDTMLFNGSAGAELFNVSANGGRALFTRNLGNIVMDLDDVERIDLRALAGADNLVVNDLAATDVRAVDVDLAETTAAVDSVLLQGRATGTDFSFRNGEGGLVATGVGAAVTVSNAGAEDLVIANGAVDAGDEFAVEGDADGETFRIDAVGTDVVVEGLDARIGIRNAALAADEVVIRGNAGDDSFETSGSLSTLANLVLDGGAGNDRILGGNGADVLLGGDGNDFVDGQQGNDTAFLGAGDDVFQWDPGDGSDVVEGQAGTDTMVFNGSAVNERFDITVNGSRERFTRDIGNITLDIDGIERIEARAGAGNDTIDASTLAAGRMQLQLFGDDGDDRILGSGGADFINGGRGADTVLMGGGNDRFQWNPGEGSDVIDGQGGFDTHEFNGSGANERFVLRAGGADAVLTRDVGNIVMDQSNVERVELLTATGTDSVEIGDLRGTDVREVLVDLAGAVGGTTGDGDADTVTLDGGVRSDVVRITTSGDDVRVNGLAASARIANTDGTDSVVVRGLNGADFLDASSARDGARLVLDGGAGNDTLIAGRGGSTLLGGADNDLLVGGAGDDLLDAGDGRDVLFGNGGDDTFVGEGDYRVIGFRAGAGSEDRVDLRGVEGLDDFGDVLAAARHTRLGVVLDFGDDEITLLGVNASQLHADDFLI